MAQQVGQPLAVLHVGLAPRHRLHMLRVDQHDRPPVALQQLEPRLPVDARRLERDLGDLQGGEPIRQRQEVGGHRPEGAHPPRHAPLGLGQQRARHDRLLVDIQPAAPLVHDLHLATPPLCRGRQGVRKRQVSYACSPPRGRRHSVLLGAPRATYTTGSRHHNATTYACRPPRYSAPFSCPLLSGQTAHFHMFAFRGGSVGGTPTPLPRWAGGGAPAAPAAPRRAPGRAGPRSRRASARRWSDRRGRPAPPAPPGGPLPA